MVDTNVSYFDSLKEYKREKKTCNELIDLTEEISSSDDEDDTSNAETICGYAKYTNLLSPWRLCTIVRKKNDTFYDISFMHDKNQSIKTCVNYELAEYRPPKTKLSSQTRVIAKLNSVRYPGMIGFFAANIYSCIYVKNNCYYLLFFDNGRCDYVPESDIRVVYGDPKWSQVHSNAANFMKYLFDKTLPGRLPMHSLLQNSVRKQINTRVCIESNGRWKCANVIDRVFDDLIKIRYDRSEQCEWIFRGSLRLSSIWRVLHSTLPTTNPLFETSTILLSSDDEDSDTSERMSTTSTISASESTKFYQEHAIVKQMLAESAQNNKKYYQKKASHECSENCHPTKLNYIECSELLKPMLLGWHRQKKRLIRYVSPCGKTLQHMFEIHRYLKRIKCKLLDVNNFSFDRNVDCLRTSETYSDAKYILNDVNKLIFIISKTTSITYFYLFFFFIFQSGHFKWKRNDIDSCL